MMTQIPSNKQTYQSPNSMTMNSANWSSSISLFSPIMDAFKSRIHTTLNDATTNALKAVGGGLNPSAVASISSSREGISSI